MAPKPEDVLQHLVASDSETQLHAVRSIKNEIIGSHNKKLFYIELGAVPRIVQLLATRQERSLTIQSAATLGSFAYSNPDGVTAIVESGGLAHLLKALSNEDEKILEVSLRSLKMIFQSPKAPRDLIFMHPAFDRLLVLLKHPKRAFGEDVATIFARCCRTKHQQEMLLNARVLEGLSILLTSSLRNNQLAALDALVSLSRDNQLVCEALLKGPQIEATLLNFTRDVIPQFRFLSCSILTQINCTLPTTPNPPLAFREQKHVLQVLVKLLQEPTVHRQVAEILANLTEEREDLQRAAYEADAAKTLCGFLKDSQLLDNSLRYGVLRALGTICRHLAACREQVNLIFFLTLFSLFSKIIQLNAIHEIVRSLNVESTDVKSAAAVCIMNMTRSVKDLNSDWLQSSITPLLTLLGDDSNKAKVSLLRILFV